MARATARVEHALGVAPTREQPPQQLERPLIGGLALERGDVGLGRLVGVGQPFLEHEPLATKQLSGLAGRSHQAQLDVDQLQDHRPVAAAGEDLPGGLHGRTEVGVEPVGGLVVMHRLARISQAALYDRTERVMDPDPRRILRRSIQFAVGLLDQLFDVLLVIEADVRIDGGRPGIQLRFRRGRQLGGLGRIDHCGLRSNRSSVVAGHRR